LDLYGLDLHPARDMENVEIYIGVGYSGIVVYRDRIRIGRFAWPKVLRISYKKNCFYLKIRPDYVSLLEKKIIYNKRQILLQSDKTNQPFI
uniref:FERM domain-containing protein n=1 Tax=Hydatigena taeniaeformis TaxID=6205 RepID=A0A0R3XCS9_HYDTA